MDDDAAGAGIMCQCQALPRSVAYIVARLNAASPSPASAAPLYQHLHGESSRGVAAQVEFES